MSDATSKQIPSTGAPNDWQSIGSLAEALVRYAEAERVKELEVQN